MSNKRIRKKWQKKQAEARYHHARIEFVGWLSYSLCPGESQTRQLVLAQSLWQRDDGYLLKTYEYLMRRSSPLLRVMPMSERPSFSFADTVGYRPSITDVRERV